MTGRLKDKLKKAKVVNHHHVPSKFNIVVLGRGTVGKSATTMQFTQSIFSDHYGPTIEDSFSKQCIIDGIPSHLDILDTSGQEEFAALREDHMRRGEGFLIMYSVTDRQSFEEVDMIRNSLLRVKDRHDIPMVIAGNKMDLIQEREVEIDAAEKLVEAYGSKFCDCIETSAKTRENIEEAFIRLVRIMRKHRECSQNPPSLSHTEFRRRRTCAVL